MDLDFTLTAEARSERGKNESRRLRKMGKIPAIIYGGGEDPASVTFEHAAVMNSLQNEAFYSHILTIDVDGKPQQAILRDLQRHPYKSAVLHMDFLRVRTDTEINVHVPLHFLNEDTSAGVKLEGGVVSHNFTEIEISCLPKHLPEFIAVDVQELKIGESLHLSDIKVPDGITIVELAHGEGHDHAVVVIHAKRVVEEFVVSETDEEAVEGAEGEESVESNDEDNKTSSGDDSS